MALETGSYITDLVITNPPGTDQKSTLDDHIRLVKKVVKNCFPGHAGAVLVAGTDGGSVNAYTITPTTALVGYVDDMIAMFTPTETNTSTTVTLNISSLGTRNLKTVSGDAPAISSIVSGHTYFASYNNSASEFRLIGVTKHYVDNLSFSAALPSQTGNSGKVITTDGSSASWTDELKDGTIRFVDSTDTTKKIAFEISGVTTGTTRTITVPDKSGTLGMTSDAGVAKMWIKCDAAGNIDASHNVTSIADNGAGDVTVTIATDFSSVNYCVNATVEGNSFFSASVFSQTAGAVQVKNWTVSGGLNQVGDPAKYHIACYGTSV